MRSARGKLAIRRTNISGATEDLQNVNSERDQGSFEILFRRYYRPVTAYFQKRGFSSEESRDLAQRTFLHALSAFSSLRDGSSASSWLFAVAINVLRSELRHQSVVKRAAPAEALDFEMATDTQPTEDEDFVPPSTPATDSELALDRLLDRERDALLRKALSELPSRMRETVLLRVGRDLTYREIAAFQQVSIATVKADMFRARKKLRELLVDYFSAIDF